jgi:two-component system KDP operon response regulator KdpE
MVENSYRILIVDDEQEIRRFLRASLKTHQHTVLEAENGKDALSLHRESNPDLMILDLGLPDIDGVEVTRRVREWSQTPIIILTVRNLFNQAIWCRRVIGSHPGCNASCG